MSQEKNKFIITKDKQMADSLLKSNFTLVSNMSGTYFFLNEVPHKFNFDNFDKSKIAYTSILAI